MVKGKQLVKENASKDLFVCTITLRMPNVENTWQSVTSMDLDK